MSKPDVGPSICSFAMKRMCSNWPQSLQLPGLLFTSFCTSQICCLPVCAQSMQEWIAACGHCASQAKSGDHAQHGCSGSCKPDVMLFVQAINALGKKARDGTISIDDMAGGTFTISNGGVYGSLLSTPIINPPQSAILGMHSITQRPMVVGKEILPRPVMNVALTYDHRLIDGREAVTFLRRVKDVVEDPRRLLLDC